MNRELLKKDAKEKVMNNFWTCILVMLLPSILGFISYRLNSMQGMFSNRYQRSFNYMYRNKALNNVIATQNNFVLNIIIWVASILIGYLIVRFFMQNSKTKATFEDMTTGLSSTNFFNYVKMVFISSIKIILWSCLFIIPGIIKTFEYTFVPYIAIDHPEYSVEECFALSKRLTDGRKMDIFVLYLSFIGWDLLAAITFGLATPFVLAYQSQTIADLYYHLTGNI